MTERTNLRIMNDSTIFFVLVSKITSTAYKKDYIKAIVAGIGITPIACNALDIALAQETSDNCKLYKIPFNREEGITTPTKAVRKAIDLFKG